MNKEQNIELLIKQCNCLVGKYFVVSSTDTWDEETNLISLWLFKVLDVDDELNLIIYDYNLDERDTINVLYNDWLLSMDKNQRDVRILEKEEFEELLSMYSAYRDLQDVYERTLKGERYSIYQKLKSYDKSRESGKEGKGEGNVLFYLCNESKERGVV